MAADLDVDLARVVFVDDAENLVLAEEGSKGRIGCRVWAVGFGNILGECRSTAGGSQLGGNPP